MAIKYDFDFNIFSSGMIQLRRGGILVGHSFGDITPGLRHFESPTTFSIESCRANTVRSKSILQHVYLGSKLILIG
jgi:hypothetical protein